MRKILCVITIMGTIIIGCSKAYNNPLISDFHPTLEGTTHQFYQITYNSENDSFNIVPVPEDNRVVAFDVTPWAQYGITGASWDPVTRNWTINAYIKNPSNYIAYGVWLVFTKLGEKKLVNRDGFMYRWNGSSYDRCPFIALGKTKPYRMFPPQYREDFKIIIHWPETVNNWYPVEFIIDASYPNPRVKPMVENLQSGNDGMPNPTYYITAWVYDFQDPSTTLKVYADLSPVGLPSNVPMYDDGMHNDGVAGDSVFGITGQINAPAGSYEITVRAIDPSKNSMENDVTLQIVETRPWIDITCPDGGEIWEINSTHDITWTSWGIPGNVSILYSKDNFTSDFHLLATDEPNDGVWTWNNIPNDPSTTVRVRVCSLDLPDGVCGTSDGDFTIYRPTVSSIVVTVPNGGEDWQVGSDHAIRWISQNVSGTVKIEYSKDNFVNDVRLIASNVTNDGSYMWHNIPNDPSSTVKVRISSTDNPSVYDTSDNYFKISIISNNPCRDWIKLHEGTRPMWDMEGEIVIRSEEEWQNFLAVYHWPTPYPPTIDFEVDMVIVLMMGEKMHGGYWYSVNSICEDRWNRLVIDYYKWYPGPNCAFPWVINWPHYIFKCEKFNGTIVFNWQWMEDPCKP